MRHYLTEIFLMAQSRTQAKRFLSLHINLNQIINSSPLVHGFFFNEALALFLNKYLFSKGLYFSTAQVAVSILMFTYVHFSIPCYYTGLISGYNNQTSLNSQLPDPIQYCIINMPHIKTSLNSKPSDPLQLLVVEVLNIKTSLNSKISDLLHQCVIEVHTIKTSMNSQLKSKSFCFFCSFPYFVLLLLFSPFCFPFFVLNLSVYAG